MTTPPLHSPGRQVRRRRASALAGSVAGIAVAAATLAFHPAMSSASATADRVVPAAADRVVPAGSVPSSPYGLQPGQYLKVTNGIDVGSDALNHVWIPADPHDTWRYRDAGDLSAFGLTGFDPVEYRGSCGAFDQPLDAAKRKNLAGTGGGKPPAFSTRYTPACDPQQWDDVPTPATFDDLAAVIGGGWAPDAIAKHVEAAMLELPCVHVTHGVSAGAGRTGDLIACDMPGKPGGHGYVSGLVVDPASGRVLADYVFDAAHIETVDGKSGTVLTTPKHVPAYTRIDPLTYEVVDSITG